MDRRTTLALSLSFLLLMIYQTYVELYVVTPPVAVEQGSGAGDGKTAEPTPNAAKTATPSAPDAQVGKGNDLQLAKVQPPTPPAGEAAVEVREESLLPFDNGVFSGHIALTGAQLVDLSFLKHLDKLAPEGKPIAFLQRGMQGKGAELFFGESGFLATPDIQTPGRKTRWVAKNREGVQGAGLLELSWKNSEGLQFEKSFTFAADSYLLVVRDRVINRTAKAVPLYAFAQFVRTEPALDAGQAMAPADFQGPMGYLDKTRVQHTYETLRKADQHMDAHAGWVGFSDKYFLAALLPAATDKLKKYYFDFDPPMYRVGSVSKQHTVEPGQEVSFETRLFVGPKEIRSLEKQELTLERAIDYGWLHFIAVPLVDLLLFFNDFLHNYGLAIICLTLLVKALFYPLADKSYRSMNAMKKLQPKMEELRKLYGHDKARMNQEMMQLYQSNKVNPLGGCLPILVQIPVFFALYQVLYLSVEMRHAPFFLWIQDLSVQDPYYVLPLLMGLSMLAQTAMNPAPADPIQAKVMWFLPVIFTFMFLTFPAGLVLYWLVNNILSIAQQGYIMKKMG
ncbi:MAG: membrane protein insertase YidC [Magnetococcales bacterium]|nr:membrane protein insertase YidC [Magnetococcales bacterium]